MALSSTATYVTPRTLARETGRSLRQIRSDLHAMVESGLLKRPMGPRSWWRLSPEEAARARDFMRAQKCPRCGYPCSPA